MMVLSLAILFQFSRKMKRTKKVIETMSIKIVSMAVMTVMIMGTMIESMGVRSIAIMSIGKLGIINYAHLQKREEDLKT